MDKKQFLLTAFAFLLGAIPVSAQIAQNPGPTISDFPGSAPVVSSNAPGFTGIQGGAYTPKQLRGILDSSVRMYFANLGSLPEKRAYDAAYVDYVGRTGFMTDDQLKAVRRLDACLYLERGLTPSGYQLAYFEEPSEELRSNICSAFEITQEELDLRLMLLARNISGEFNVQSNGPQFRGNQLFAQELSQDVAEASFDEIQPIVEAQIKEQGFRFVFESLVKLGANARTHVFECVYERSAASLNDADYAWIMEEVLSNRAKQAERDGADERIVEIENAVEKAMTERPQSWEIRFAAVNVLQTLPNTALASADGGEPRRAFVDGIKPGQLELLKQLRQECGLDPDPRLEKLDKQDIMYTQERDRVRAIQILSETADEAAQAIFQPQTGAYASTRYLSLLQSTLQRKYGSEPSDLNAKTGDLPLPDYGKTEERAKNYDGVNPLTFPLPIDYKSAKNDGERLTFLSDVLSAANDLTGLAEEWQRLASYGANARGKYGIKHALEQWENLQRRIVGVLPPDVPNNAAEQEKVADGKRKLEKAQALFSGIKELQDDETYRAPTGQGQIVRNPDQELDGFKFDVVKLGFADFMKYLKRSNELHENYLALSELALEYQLRDQPEKANEYWERAEQVVEDPFVSPAERRRNKELSREAKQTPEELKKARLAEIEALRALRTDKKVEIDVNRSYAEGTVGRLAVQTNFSGELTFRAIQLDLAPTLASTRDSQYKSSNASFDQFVKDEYLRRKTREANREPIVWKEQFELSDNAKTADKTVELPFHEPGTYVVQTELEGAVVKETLMFLSAYDVCSRDGRFRIVDLTTGKPYANREVELYVRCSSPDAPNTFIMKTDELGGIERKSVMGPYDNGLFVLQPDDPQKFDVEVSVFDTKKNAKNVPEFLTQRSSSQQNQSCYVALASAKPVLLPGDSVELKGQILPKSANQVRKAMEYFAAIQNAEKVELASFKFQTNEQGCFTARFDVPETAEPGKYSFVVCDRLVPLTSGQAAMSFFHIPIAWSPIYIGTKGKEVVADVQKPDPTDGNDEANDAANNTVNNEKQDGEEDFVTLHFLKDSYEIGETAKFILRSQVPDQEVLVYKQRKWNGVSSAIDEKIVKLENGQAGYECAIEQTDSQSVVIVVQATRGGRTQTHFYKVGTHMAGDERVRKAEITVPSAPVKRGEKFVVEAKFSSENADEEGFTGNADVAVFDARLPYASGFENYLSSRSANAKAGRIDGARAFAVDATRKVPKNQRPSMLQFSDFIVEYKPNVPQNRTLIQTSGGELSPNVNVPNDVKTKSIFLSKDVSEPVSAVRFEVEAPSEPGEWKVVFRAVDSKFRVVCKEAAIVVE